MMNRQLRPRFFLGSVALLAAASCLSAGRPDPAPLPPVLSAMQNELDRSMATLSQADPSTYFVSYTVSDRYYAEVSGSNGALLSSTDDRARWLEVQSRVGAYQLDDTHKVGDRPPSWTSPGTTVSLDDDIPILRREIWRETDRQYRAAAEALIKVKTSQQVQVQTAEGAAPDFSREDPHTSIGPRVEIHVDRRPWEDRVRRYTAAFSKSPSVLNSIATFTAQATNQYQVNTEGTKLAFGLVHYRLELFVQSKAPDGMDIDRYANFDWLDPKDAPDEKTVAASIQTLIHETESLDAAPLADPYAGPTLLTGRAAAVFFHEVFGHRAEGFRQKDISEGQTFTSKIGEKILPDFISIKDDPTEASLGGHMLLGNYPFDDEGVPATNVAARRSRRAENVSDVALAAREHSALERPRPAPAWIRSGRAPGQSDRLEFADRANRAAAPKTDRAHQGAEQALRAADRRYRGRLHLHGPRHSRKRFRCRRWWFTKCFRTAGPTSWCAAWILWGRRLFR